MAAIDDRITALKTKLETLEEEKKAKERAARQAERQRARKVENQRRFELGGLAKVAGLFDCDKGALLGAFLSLQPLLASPERLSEFKRVGDALLMKREAERKDASQQQAMNESYLR